MSDPIRDRVDENLKHLTNAVDRKDEAMSEHEPKPVAYHSVVTALQEEVGRLRTAIGKVNAIRNSIIGCQKMNWSEHIYPLVAALNEAGIEGQDYPEAREYVGTMLERTLAAEARANAAEQRVKEAVKVLEPFASVIEDYDPWKEGDDTQGTLVIGSVTDYRLTLGDLRAARAFIKEAGNE